MKATHVRQCVLWLAVAAMASSCGSDAAAPDDGGAEDEGLIISFAILPGPGAGTVAYLSLRPGTAVGATTARIQNLRSGELMEASMEDGGLDPVEIPAELGDTLELSAMNGDSTVAVLRATVRARRPPVVVRPKPPHQATDVALNASIRVVFSQPLDPGTVTSGTVQLVLNQQPVTGTVTLLASGIEAAFEPTAPLQPGANYTIEILEGIADRDGEALVKTFQSGFKTLTVASVTPLPADTSAPAGAPVQLGVVVRGPTGQVLTGVPVTWTSSDPAIAAVDPAGLVRAKTVGMVTITAAAAGISATATVRFAPMSFASVSAGERHTCGLGSDGRAYCWGANDLGQASEVDGSSQFSPFLAVENTRFGSVAAGGKYSCGVDVVGMVRCWGTDRYPPGTNVPRVASMDAAASHACAILTDGLPFCWGYYGFDLILTNYGWWTPGWNATPAGVAFTEIATGGGDFDCGIAAISQHLYCWGHHNDLGQISEYGVWEGFDPSANHVPYAVDRGGAFTTLALGADHGCGLGLAGEAICWGLNASGQVGVSGPPVCVAITVPPTLALVPCETRPVPVQTGLSFTAITAGGNHTCALTAGGEAYCWGSNATGELGDGSTTDRGVPTAVAGGLLFQSLSAGGTHTCGQALDGVVYCWGDNKQGQLGVSTVLSRSPSPVRVALQP